MIWHRTHRFSSTTIAVTLPFIAFLQSCNTARQAPPTLRRASESMPFHSTSPHAPSMVNTALNFIFTLLLRHEVKIPKLERVVGSSYTPQRLSNHRPSRREVMESPVWDTSQSLLSLHLRQYSRFGNGRTRTRTSLSGTLGRHRFIRKLVASAWGDLQGFLLDLGNNSQLLVGQTSLAPPPKPPPSQWRSNE
jgi:hypothetical protein